MNALIPEKMHAIRQLCEKYRVKQLELFGSAARDDLERPNNDFDFLVEFLQLRQGEYADTYFGLLEDLQVVLGHPIDLVMVRAVKNPYFLESIRSTRQVLYAN